MFVLLEILFIVYDYLIEIFIDNSALLRDYAKYTILQIY